MQNFKNLKLGTKLIAFIIIAFVVTSSVVIGMAVYQFGSYNNKTNEQKAVMGMEGLSKKLTDYKEKSLHLAGAVSLNPEILKAIEKRNSEALFKVLDSIAKTSGADFITVTDNRGIVLARSHDHEKMGDDATNQVNVHTALKGTAFATIEPGMDAKLAVRGGAPVKNENGQIAGVISVGYRLDKPEFVDELKELFKTDVTLFLGDERFNTTIVKDGKRLIGTKLDSRIADLVLNKNERYTGKAKILDLPYICAYMPLINSSNETIGVVFAGQPEKEALSTRNKVVFMVVIISLVSILIILLLIIAFVRKNLTNPLKELVEVSNMLSVGDIDVSVEAKSSDEIGMLTSSYCKMIENIKEQARIAERIAAGDLDVDIKEKSQKDIMSKNMKLVVSTLRTLISEMDNMSKQHDAGDIDVEVDEGKFEGAYKVMAAGVNNMVKDHIVLNKKAMACVAQLGKGSFDAELELFAGKKRFINENIEELRENLKKVAGEIKELVAAASEGKLSQRSDYKAYDGDWSLLLRELNRLLDVIVEPVKEAARVLEQMSKGNLTKTVEGDYNGDHGAIKDALNNTITSFNNLLGNIIHASEQVAAGSRQVSDSSQALSQGSTEQASSIEELSASVEEIASQTKQNAIYAKQANELSITAQENAVQGNARMNEMLRAMDEINQASASISKIIKVIDEIAFQTNILALNAAVEAARAGQHGKGFAVVAEEVRNLAARSASAAKETTVLIEGSIKKTEAGTKIANETAAALSNIVEAVAKAATLVGDIAIASNEQATAISQINLGINQVSQVTQTNSATAEECAAASEELSSQAEMLREMVRRFRLSGGHYNNRTQNGDSLERTLGIADGTDIFDDYSKEDTKGTSKVRIALPDMEFGKY